MSQAIPKYTNQNRFKKLEERASFVIAHSGYFNESHRETIETELQMHELYGTLLEVRSKEGIIALVRFNWVSPTEVRVLDAIVHPEHRHKNLIKLMILRAKIKMPNMNEISFTRHKYDDESKKKLRKYNVEKLLGVHYGK